MKGIDFSWARPGGAAIKAAGYDFVMRYVPYVGDGGKGLTLAEVADYHAHGLGIGLVFESTASRHLDGYDAGRADGLQCIESGRALGFPTPLAFFFGTDFDAQPAQFAAMDAYQLGTASVLGKARNGIYGSYDVIEHFANPATTTTKYWQTYAWSRGRKHPARHVYQYENGVILNGGEVDLCEDYGAATWLWRPENQEEEMGMSADERAELDAFKRAVFAGKEQPGTDAERTAYANGRIAAGAQSVNDVAESAIVVALQSSGKLSPGLTSDQVRAIADQEIERAHLVPAKPGG